MIRKLTQYPITDILFNEDINISTDAKTMYNQILHDRLKIKSFLMEVGLDYFTYGNSLISTTLIPQHMLTCISCNFSQKLEDTEFKLKKDKFVGTCKNCKLNNTIFNLDTSYPKSLNNFKLIRFAPENITIDWNPISNTADYYYEIPNHIKKGIITGNKSILKHLPPTFIEAVLKKRSLKLDPNNLYHMKFPSLAEQDMGWAKPMILPAMKEIYYLQTLRRGNEAISHEHIIPKKAIFPANTTTLDPFTQMNLGKWKDQMEEQIKIWKRDPNHIGIFPIPIGYQELGGNAKMLMLTPEMKFVEESIINSLGVPLEFIKGGTSWTGSSVSLRIVENHFLTYRELLLDFLNYFLLPKLRSHFDLPQVKVHFKQFKMSDDLQYRQLMFEMVQTGKISNSRFLADMGIDPEQELKLIQNEKNQLQDAAINAAKKEAEAQGEAGLILAKYQVRTQLLAERESFQAKMEMFEDELATEHVGIPEDPFYVIEKFAFELNAMPDQNRNIKLKELASKMPITYGLVIERMNQMNMEALQQQAAIDQMMAPTQMVPSAGSKQAPNQKTPGTREGDKVKIRDKEKTKGQTRGTP